MGKFILLVFGFATGSIVTSLVYQHRIWQAYKKGVDEGARLVGFQPTHTSSTRKRVKQ